MCTPWTGVHTWAGNYAAAFLVLGVLATGCTGAGVACRLATCAANARLFGGFLGTFGGFVGKAFSSAGSSTGVGFGSAKPSTVMVMVAGGAATPCQLECKRNRVVR